MRRNRNSRRDEDQQNYEKSSAHYLRIPELPEGVTSRSRQRRSLSERHRPRWSCCEPSYCAGLDAEVGAAAGAPPSWETRSLQTFSSFAKTGCASDFAISSQAVPPA